MLRLYDDELLFPRRDIRDTPITEKAFKIISAENSDKDWLMDDPNGTNNYREIIGIGIGFELKTTQEVSIIANVEVCMPMEFNGGEIHGCDIKIVVDGTNDVSSERKKNMKLTGLAMAADTPRIILQTAVQQSLAAGYHRISIRAQGKEPTADWWGYINANRASLIAIIGG